MPQAKAAKSERNEGAQLQGPHFPQDQGEPGLTGRQREVPALESPRTSQVCQKANR
mgnify:FL=1